MHVADANARQKRVGSTVLLDGVFVLSVGSRNDGFVLKKKMTSVPQAYEEYIY